MKSTDYKNSGVDLEAAEASGPIIGKLAKSTFTPGVLTEIGLFGGCFELDVKRYHQPVLVASVDGVGTKLKIAFMMGRHHTIGQDLVNHCVNDIMTSGADPLFFLDYLALNKLELPVVRDIIAGMAQACRENDCALIGGETAEMPGFYHPGEYDVAGCMIGVAEKSRLINGARIQAGDLLVGLPSTGLHTNGYSLARKVFFDLGGFKIDDHPAELPAPVGESLLAVHRSYRQAIQALREIDGLNGISHITGGGIVGNTKRLLNPSQKVSVDWSSWDWPPLFQLIQKLGSIPDAEMQRVFNLGIGIIFVLAPAVLAKSLQQLTALGETPRLIGRIDNI